MKKSQVIKIAILFIVLLINMVINSFAMAQEYYLGDINQDGKVDISDELMLLRHICAVKTEKQETWLLSEDELAYADITEDNKVDITDVLYIQRYIAASKEESVAQKHPDWLEYVKKITIPQEPEQISPTGVSFDRNVIIVVLGDQTKQKLNATISPTNANRDTELIWESEDEQVAKVSQSGEVTAVGIGKTTIKATTANGKIASCMVIVMEEESPKVVITRLYDGNVMTAGTTVSYLVAVTGKRIESVDISKIKLIGDLANESKFEIIGSEPNYEVLVTLPNKVGTIGIKVEEGMATNISGKKSDSVQTSNDYVFTLEETVTSNSISIGVGVHNSFYVKDYDFYLDDVKMAEDRTTNEYTYTGLTEGKTYQVKVFVTVYLNKTSDDTVSGWLEKDITVTKNDGVEVHFIDVVGSKKAADCIFIKTANGKTILIDTGADNTAEGYENKVAQIDQYLRKNKNGRNGEALLTASNGIVAVDYVILTHQHIDHVGGFAGLTGVHYQATSPGYFIDENNQINGDKVRYEFGKIILGCNATIYKGDEVLQKDGVNIPDGAEGIDTTQAAKDKAIYCYANATDKLVKVTAGNVLKIDNTIFNIFWPYPRQDISSAWLSSQGSGIRRNISVTSTSTTKKVYDMTATNNNSIVIKLINGHRKMLLMGDAEFYTEEILLGIPAKQVASKSSTLEEGLQIDSSNGGTSQDSAISTDYTSLVYDLVRNEFGGCTTVEQLENKYKISRLTPKDLEAQILKKGHHDIGNSTSISFLNTVRPSKIVTTGFAHYSASIVRAVENSTDYRIRQYYNSDYCGLASGKVVLTPNNWFNHVFCVKEDKTNKGKGSFYIFTGNGRSWDSSNAYQK